MDRDGAVLQLAIIVPCFNEEEVLPLTLPVLIGLMRTLVENRRIAPNSRICVVDDGSSDGTWDVVCRFSKTEPSVCGIRLAANAGHQKALLAGILNAEGDAVVTIDADLQHEIAVIEKMLDQYAAGADIVFGVRRNRRQDSLLKRVTAIWFYRLMKLLSANQVAHSGDFRLMSRKAVEALREYPEVNLYLRGVVAMLGFSTATVAYDIKERPAGASKYSLRRMISLALNGITSFSLLPLRLISILGFLIAVLSAIGAVWVAWTALFTDKAVAGWASTLIPIFFLGGAQLLSLGIIGEYVGRTYMEAKGRPRYVVQSLTGAIRTMPDRTQFARSEPRNPGSVENSFTESDSSKTV